MNERIQKLLLESIEDCDGTMKDRVYSLKQSEIEKFAELIVQECMSITGKCSTGSGIHDLFADEIIAEHFGVEE